MKSIRLNKSLRNEIACNISQAYNIKNKPPLVINPMDQLRDKLIEIFLKQSADVLMKAKHLGIENSLDLKNYFEFKFKGSIHILYLYDKFGEAQYTPILGNKSGIFTDLDNLKCADVELVNIHNTYLSAYKKVRPLKTKYKLWKKDKDNYMADVINVLDGVNTTGQLLEVWEECAKFLPLGILNPSNIKLPTVSITQLNKHI